ncbi:MAG TPA: hypothetical protein ENJ35_08025, partial [Gammaproteobacteria bacterium]|nr:hypothetical protein [Gammaproteobacteria bacterium]
TREDTVRDRLLFKPGERYSGRVLDETERLLRNTSFLDDARVRPIDYHDGVVDVEVQTYDIWTLNPGISFGRSGGKNSAGFELEERNLLGYGSEMVLSIKSTVDRDTVKLIYQDPNVGSSWWNLRLFYSNNSDGAGKGIDLQRPFYALDTRDAYGFALNQETRVEPRYDLGEIVDEFEVETRTAKLFRGWSAGLHENWVSRVTGGISVEWDQFASVAGNHPTLTLPEDRKLVYPWISREWIQDEFRKEFNRDQIRKTEDVSLGWNISLRLGYASPDLGADRYAWLLKSAMDKGFKLSRRQTVLMKAELAGRMEHGTGKNIRISELLRYYFRQSPHRLTFLSLGADFDINPDADRQLLLGGDNGLRGYPLRYQGGEGRWLLSLEQRLYTNWYPFRLFNVGAALFADVGSTWGDNPYGSQSLGLLRDLGFGLRLGNSRSALGNVIHLDFAFPLDGDADISKFQFLVQTKRSF